MMIKIQGKKEQIENLTDNIVSSIGVNQIAYIKSYIDDEKELFAVHAADGTELSVFDDRETAEALIRYNNLQQVTVH